jgi:hypothetical protein
VIFFLYSSYSLNSLYSLYSSPSHAISESQWQTKGRQRAQRMIDLSLWSGPMKAP